MSKHAASPASPASPASLIAWLDQRERQLRALLDAHPREDGGEHEVTDLKDGAVEEARADVEGAEMALHLAELHQIEAARARLAAGTYGACSDCGEPIAAARLQAQPAASRCTACQTAAEPHRR